MIHVVITHGHRDPDGGLSRVREPAWCARLLAHPLDGIDDAEPRPFTADRVVAEESIGKFSDSPGARMLFAHGPELPDVWSSTPNWLDRALICRGLLVHETRRRSAGWPVRSAISSKSLSRWRMVR